MWTVELMKQGFKRITDFLLQKARLLLLDSFRGLDQLGFWIFKNLRKPEVRIQNILEFNMKR